MLVARSLAGCLPAFSLFGNVERRKIAPYIKKGQQSYVGKGFLKFTTHTYITAATAAAVAAHSLARIQWLYTVVGNILYEVERTKRKSKERDISGETGVRNIISLLVCAPPPNRNKKLALHAGGKVYFYGLDVAVSANQHSQLGLLREIMVLFLLGRDVTGSERGASTRRALIFHHCSPIHTQLYFWYITFN